VAAHDSPIELIKEVSFELGADLARQIDILYQDTIDAGTNVIYSSVSDASAGRTNIDSGDIVTIDYITKAASYLNGLSARPYDGEFFVAVMHPHVAHDLKVATALNGWTEVNKYTGSVSKIFK